MKKTLLVVLLSCLWMAACGQKGPLYLPLDEASEPGFTTYEPSLDETAQDRLTND